jgi:stage III sporulation protein SpoIIIAA
MMACLEHVDCHECQLNREIIELICDLISKQIFQGMEKWGARVAVHVNRRDHLLTIMSIRSSDIPEVLSIDEQCSADCRRFVRELKPGESLVMMTTHGTDHIGIYKLSPRRPLH